MSNPPSELEIPPAAYNDPNSVEMLRAWIAEKQLHCSMNVGEWHRDGRHDERLAWGLLLADVAGHVASEMQQATGLDAGDSLRLIASTFSSEVKRSLAENDGASSANQTNSP
jgi:hypothetical protein